MKKIVIVGQGEQGLIIKNILEKDKSNRILGFLDDNKKTSQTLGRIKDYQKYLSSNTHFFIALGNNRLRKKLFVKFKQNGAKFVNAIHDTAVIEEETKLGNNVFVGALSYIGINCYIGDATFLNNHCSIDHDNKISKFCHLAPGVVTAGGVKVKDESLVGIGSTIMEDLTVGKNSIVGANSNLIINAKANSVYYGNPAKYVKKNAN